MTTALNEELKRMKELAGIKPINESEILEEGLLANIAVGLGLTIGSLTSVFSQTGELNNLKYSQDKKEALEQAMENPDVQEKLKELGVNDNNIAKQIERLQGKEPSGFITKKTISDVELKHLLKLGYHLTSIERDTIIKKLKDTAPDHEVHSISLKMDEDVLFESGKFQLSQTDSHNIKVTLDSIQKSGSVLIGVKIESSTDNQGISPRLKIILKNLGYSQDNEGLSNARSNGVEVALNAFKVSSSIIVKNVLFEQGSGIIDPSARYVVVVFDIVPPPPPIIPEPKDHIQIKTVYSLILPLIKGSSKWKIPPIKLKKIKIKNYDCIDGCPIF